jgi:hypothetical protein
MGYSTGVVQRDLKSRTAVVDIAPKNPFWIGVEVHWVIDAIYTSARSAEVVLRHHANMQPTAWFVPNVTGVVLIMKLL